MSAQNIWNRYCDCLRVYPELGMQLDISRMRFSDSFFSSMRAAAEQAISGMQKLEAGDISNPDENRMVGHYWLRTPAVAPSKEIAAEISSEVEKIKKFAAAVHSGSCKPEKAARFNNVLLVGIGGSALGPQLVADALGSTADKMQIFFCDNTDPDGIARLLTKLGAELNQTLVIVISKSGGTIETRNGALEVAEAYHRAGLNFGKHAVAVTVRGSKVEQQAQREGWIESFFMWDWVGGRTSITSAVGLLPAALQGLDIDEFLAGAAQMDELTRSGAWDQNPALVLALMWHFAGEGKGRKDMVVLPYKDRLVLFSKYLQQLVMESLGKDKNLQGETVNQGIAVYGNKGSTDQHAYVQQLRDGLNNFFVTFIEVQKDYVGELPHGAYQEVEDRVTSGDYLNGFYQGTRRALYENGRDSISITVRELTPKTLGALIALYERAVGFYALLVGINAYHQPGVEAGKKAAGRVIEIQRALLDVLLRKSGQALTLNDLVREAGATEEIESAYKILEHLAANPERKIRRTGGIKPTEASYTYVG